MRMSVHIWALLLLLMTGACTSQNPEIPREKVDWELSVSTALDASFEDTKAVEDGDSFHNLLVLLVRDGKVMQKKTWPENPATPSEDYVLSQELIFRGLEVGSYDVYAMANYDQTEWQTEPYIAASELNLQPGDEFSPDRLLTAVLPEGLSAGTPMLLSGHSVVAVDVATSIGTLKLYRPVARFRVWMNNHTPYPIQVNAMSFNGFYANKGYLFGQSDQAGLPLMPDGCVLSELPSISSSTGEIAAGARARVYNHLLYEMQMPNGYPCRMYAKVTMLNGDNNPVEEMGTPETGALMKQINNETSQVSRLTYLRRNEDVNVEVNVYYKIVEDGSVQLLVDNEYWEGNGHESTHTYN